MINRIAANKLQKLYGLSKVIAVTGPRQSGKTTLVKAVFPDKPYINLENPDTRQYSVEDPRGFLSQYPDGAILDEAQRSPLLFSYLQEIIDNKRETGQFILTGSNNFMLNEKISQTLAGRVAYINLLPLSLEEVYPLAMPYNENDYILQGFYPVLYDRQLGSTDWIPDYIRTYIERDVRQIKNITDLLIFERFMRLLAGRTGQEINYSSLSIEVGVDVKTIQSWIGILESSFIIFLLRPYHKNYNKTVVKRPKLYFYDTAIACSLLNITILDHLSAHPLRGALFECFIVSEMMKKQIYYADERRLFFWREKTGKEIDLIFDEADHTTPVEIKAGKTIHSEFFRNIRYWMKLTGEKSGRVIYAGDINQKRSDGIEIISWKDLFKPF